MRTSDPDRVTAVRQAMRPTGTVALLDGEMCVCDLAEVCGQSESGVSHARARAEDDQ